MKIALFADSWFPTIDGVAVSAMADFLRLREQGHDVSVYVPKMPGMKNGKGNKGEKSVNTWLSLPVPHYKDHAIALVPPPSFLTRAGGYDLVYYHGTTPSFAYSALGQARLLGQRFVWRFTTFVPDYLRHAEYFIHSYVSNYLGDRIAGVAARGVSHLLSKAWGHFLKHVPYAVVANESCANYVADRSKAQVLVIPPRPLPPGKVNGDPFPEIPRGKRIAVLARLSPEKNLEAAVDTFVDHIYPKHKDAHLVMMGDGPSREGLEKRARGNPNVKFVGMVPNENVHSFLSYSDLFLYTSLSETHGLVVEEAKRAGLPIVAFDDDRGVTAQVKGIDCGKLAPPDRNDLLGEYASVVLAQESLRKAMGVRGKADHERRAAPVQAFFPDLWL
jgi:1,2-diacylglycerol 3-alpha-glucosyltransferase